jgi:DMSO/TMAO reductase YedYZ molybdopterin-dependent catalytic subunit
MRENEADIPASSGRGLARREFLSGIAGGAAAAALAPRFGWAAEQAAAPAAAGDLSSLRFPEKGQLIVRSDRPVNLEMPTKYFREEFTPNDLFYVRWHLGIMVNRVDLATYRIRVGGHVEHPLEISLDDLQKNFEAVSVNAVNQCSGNSRSLYEPRMPGVQWGNGACGHAKWTGVRLKDILAKAGAKAGAVDVTFGGMDGPTLPAAENFAGTPDFVKSLPFERASTGDAIVAYAMNDKPLPMLNGFPARLVVPGLYATYWVKALDEINVLDKKFEGFWMAKAYRVPNTPSHQEAPKELAKETIPINTMTVRSLFASPEPGEKIAANAAYEVRGVAFDGGKGIAKVEISADGGQSWQAAKLDRDLGNYAWRRWSFEWTPKPGKHELKVKATNNAGETQTTAQWNRSGYARNVIESVEVTAA